MPSIPLSDCVWPDVSQPYLSAFQDAVDFVAREFDSVVGVFACGSVTRGAGDASSDIDLYVVHRANFRQRLQKFFRGVPAEIFVNPANVIEGYFEEDWHSRRLLTAHMLGTGVLVWQSDPVVLALQAQARAFLARSPDVPADLTMHRYLLACGFEDALDKLEKDPPTARLILNALMQRLLDFAFLKAGVRVPRFKDMLSELRRNHPALGDLALCFYGADSLEEQVAHAEALMDALVGARGFFEWSSPPETTQNI